MNNDLKQHMAKKLKQARERKGLTQAEVAQLIGSNTNYYAKLERGEGLPSLPKFMKIITVLDVHSTDVLPR